MLSTHKQAIAVCGVEPHPESAKILPEIFIHESKFKGLGVKPGLMIKCCDCMHDRRKNSRLAIAVAFPQLSVSGLQPQATIEEEFFHFIIFERYLHIASSALASLSSAICFSRDVVA